MPHPEIKAVIFDCDGTLVDSEPISLRVLLGKIAEQGLTVSHDDAMNRWAGGDLADVLKEVESEIGRPLPGTFIDDFRAEQMAELGRSVVAIDGAAELLRTLSKPRCVASNAPVDKIRLCLKTTGLFEHFDEERIFSAYQLNAWKPRPDLFLHAAQQLDVAPANCAVVEDSLFGVEAGLNAGMRVFAYDIPREKLGNRSVTSIDDLTELIPIFAESR